MQHGRVTFVHGTDRPILAAVAELLVAAAQRGEALGLSADITRTAYEKYLGNLMLAAQRGDAGLAVVRAEDCAKGRAVIGSAQWTRSPYPTRRVLAELDRVVVSPQARGAGLGAALVEAVTADARAAGIELLVLEVRGNNHAAIALYRRLGFERTGVLRNAVAAGTARHDVILMSRDLGRPKDIDLLGELPVGAGASLPRAGSPDASVGQGTSMSQGASVGQGTSVSQGTWATLDASVLQRPGWLQGTDWLRTERLLLCVPSTDPDVVDAYFAIHADPATNAHNPAGPMVDPKAAAPVLELWRSHWRELGFGYWTVRGAAQGRILGFGGVRPVGQDEDFLNLYYRFRPSAWGNGYATEVGRAALAVAASSAPGIPVVALIRPGNEPSIRVARRLGMQLEGETQRQFGTYLRYAILP